MESVYDQIGETTIDGTTYPIRRGLAVTTHDLTRSVGYQVQKAWYDAQGLPEPARVKARREAILAEVAAGFVEPAPKPAAAPVPDGTPTAAELIRKGLIEGADTKTIVATVKAFRPDSNAGAKDVAYYRYALRKEGKLPARGTS